MENPGLYSAYEAFRNSLMPVSELTGVLEKKFTSNKGMISKTPVGRFLGAYNDVINRTTKYYSKPEFGIDYVKTKHGITEIVEERDIQQEFCNLLHFKKTTEIKGLKNQKKVLLASPLAGHYPTLLRETVRAILPDFDVYITEWKNARDVPLFHGPFDLDDVIATFIKYFEYFKGDINVIAVCQPTVPVLVAISHMSKEQSKFVPKTFTLMGGPIDTRISPTKVNDFANDRSLHWFSSHLITRVPANYTGAFRRVYPGFLQLFGFMSMNMKRHIGAHIDLFNDLIKNDGESAEKRKKFYDEYLAVMDIPAEFYLQTVDAVFQKHSLPLGKMKYRGQIIDPSCIKNSSLLVIEGELDDIAGPGQTKAAIKLCPNVKKAKYHLQKGAGHYGIFNGKKFTNHIAPIIKEFIHDAYKNN